MLHVVRRRLLRTRSRYTDKSSPPPPHKYRAVTTFVADYPFHSILSVLLEESLPREHVQCIICDASGFRNFISSHRRVLTPNTSYTHRTVLYTPPGGPNVCFFTARTRCTYNAIIRQHTSVTPTLSFTNREARPNLHRITR